MFTYSGFQKDLNALQDKEKSKEVICSLQSRTKKGNGFAFKHTDTKSNFPFHQVQTDHI